MDEQNSRAAQSLTTFDERPSPERHDAAPDVTPIEALTRVAVRKWFIAKVTVAAMLVGLLLGLTLPVEYTASTRIMTPQQTQSSAALMMMNQISSGGENSIAALAAGGLGFRNPSDLYVGLLNSRPVADAIIQRYNLANLYHARDMTIARQDLADNTKITSERSGFILVSITDKDKKRAADMANAYTEELRILTKSLALTEASQRRLFYEEQMKEAKEALIAAELVFQQVQQTKGLVQPEAQAKAMIEGLAGLRAEVVSKQVELKALRSYSTESNPQVQLAENELSSLQAAVAQMEQRNHSSGFSDLGMADVPVAGIDYLRAQHELLYRQTLFDLLIKQYDAARLDEAKSAIVIQVVEPAIPPDRKASPHRAQIALLFGLLAFLAASAYVFVGALVRINPAVTHSLSDLKSALIAK